LDEKYGEKPEKWGCDESGGKAVIGRSQIISSVS
jgi:hypothetical protein